MSVLSCVSLASVKEPKPVWAYDISPGVEDRAYRLFGYHNTGAELNTRRLDHVALNAFLERNFNVFLADVTISEDHKERVQRAIQSFRRGLADNDDVLTDFIVAWSSIEGLDCVYRRLLPSATARGFMDGVRDVLARLGHADVFESLTDLRNGIAHGSISLADAIQTAKVNMELARRALVLMIFRILKMEDGVATKVLAQAAYKGKLTPCVKFIATIGFEPVGEVKALIGHPVVELISREVRVKRNGEKLDVQPDLHLTPQNLTGTMKLTGLDLK